jgi:hypothetical protein
MPAIDVWDSEYRKEIDALAACVAQQENDINSRKVYDNTLHRIKGIRKSFHMEMNMLKVESMKIEYESKAKRYDIRVESLKAEYDAIVQSRAKLDRLHPPANESAQLSRPVAPVSSNDAALAGAIEMQGQTMTSLQRTRFGAMYTISQFC